MKGVTGWLLGRVQSRLISAAQSMIRSRVKAPEVGQTHTQGITFRELRAGLESNADQVLASRFRTVASRSTWFVMAVLCLVLITQWGLACWLLSSKSTSNVTSISDMHGFIRGEL